MLHSTLDEILTIEAELRAIFDRVPYSDLDTRESYNCFKLPTQTQVLERTINAYNSSKTA